MKLPNIKSGWKSGWRRILSWRWRDQLFLILLVALIAVCNVVWIHLESRPPHWDMAYHLTNALSYFDKLKGGHLKQLLLEYHYYPPLVYWTAMMAYALWGASTLVVVSANWLFVAILAFSTYGIGRALFSRRTGLLSALVVLTSPMLISQFKEFQLDAPLTAMVALSMYLLVKADGFRRRWFSILFGASLGLGVLTKWTFPFILGLPLVAAIVIAVRRNWRSHDYAWLFNLSFAGLLAYAISSPWYIANIHQVHVDLVNNGVTQGAREGDPVVGSWASNIYYLNNLLNFQLYLAPFCLFLAGLVVMVRKRKLLERSIYPLALIMGTLLFFTVLRNKDARYTLPMLSAIAVMAVAWIDGLPKRWRKLFVWSIAIYSSLSFYTISFGLPFLPGQTSLNVGALNIMVFAQHGYIIGPPSHEQWHEEELFRIISQDKTTPRTLAYSGPDTIWFNGIAMGYFSRVYEVTLVPIDTAGNEYLALRSEVPPIPPSGFLTVRQWKLPDGTELLLCRKQPQKLRYS